MPTSEPDRSRTAPVSVDAGEQVLLSLPSMTSPLTVLPETAFENLLVVSATNPPSKVERQVRERGADPETVGVVPVSGSPISYDGPMWTASVVSPNDLTGISQRFDRASRYLKPGAGWVVVDSVNVLLMYAERDTVYQFVRSVANRTRRSEARGVFAMVPDACSRSTRSRFEDLFERTIDRTNE